MQLIPKGIMNYEDAHSQMEACVAQIRSGEAGDQAWLLEHPPLYTAGTSANAADLLSADFPVYETGRGGEHTYHGPGQRVVYVMKDLRKWMAEPDLKKYIWSLEEWIILTLKEFDIVGERRDGRVGVWVVTDEGEKKIAAIGVRVRHWITFHGISINVNPDLSHYNGIVPCGLSGFGVTSFHELGRKITLDALDEMLAKTVKHVF